MIRSQPRFGFSMPLKARSRIAIPRCSRLNTLECNGAPLLLTVLVALSATPCTGHDRAYLLGRGGWQLERFGSTVAILRTTVSGPSADSNALGSLVLSCEGSERRIRLALPEDIVAASDLENGRALIRLAGRPEPGRANLLASASLERRRVLLISDKEPLGGGVVVDLVRLLQEAPTRLELLVAFDRGPIALNRVASYPLALSFTGGESVAFADFISACAPAGR